MVVALDPAHREAFENLARRHEVEVSVIGRFTDRGVLEVSHEGRACASMDLSFLEEDFPPWEFEAEWLPPEMRLSEPVLGEVEDQRACSWRCWPGPISVPGSGSPASMTMKSRA
jgi:phosphoribosylformylglycinamidine synthase subunit PurSL